VNKIDKTLRYSQPVILVGPADFDIGFYQKLSDQGYRTVAADGGANRLYDCNIMPEAIIGDLDSLNNRDDFDSTTKIIQIHEQETTDFEKCLNHLDAPAILAMGFTGKRLDHTLSNIHTITKFHKSKNVLLVGSDDVSFVYSGNYNSPMEAQTTISIFPLQPIEFSKSEGLVFTLKRLNMGIGHFVGTSNRTNGSKLLISPTDYHLDTPYLITLSGDNLLELISFCLKNSS